MSAEPLMWVVEWTEPNRLFPEKRRTVKQDFLHREDAQAFIDGDLDPLYLPHLSLSEVRSSLSDEDAATLTLKRAPFADRLEAWLKALRKNGIRSRKNVSQAAMSKMNPDAPTVFHTGYQGSAYEAWGDEVYYKSCGQAVQVLFFNHDNMTPMHYDALRTLLDAYGLPYGWDGTEWSSIQIITPHGALVLHVCDFCEEVAQGAYSVDVGAHRMCKACAEVNE